MRVLTPTENHRLNELIGFIGMTIAILVALALISYSPHDPSFNVSADSAALHSARNWIGPVGAYGADLLFQGFGYAAFLLPVGMFIMGSRWFRSEAAGISGHQNCRLLAAGADASRDAHAVARAGSSRRDSARRIAGTSRIRRLARRFQHGGSKPGGRGDFLRRAFPDHKIFVHRNSRNPARPARQTEFHCAAEGSLRRLARRARREAHAEAPRGNQIAGPPAHPRAIRGRSGWQRGDAKRKSAKKTLQ